VKENLTHDGPITGSLIAAALYGVILAGITVSYSPRAWWVIGSFLCGALVAALVKPPHDVWLDGDVLVSRRGLRMRRLPLPEVWSVRIDWIPRAGDLMVQRGDQVRIGLRRLDDDSAGLRRAIGHLVPPVAVDRGQAGELLFLPDDH
jgi:hypothetical protein